MLMENLAYMYHGKRECHHPSLLPITDNINNQEAWDARHK
jgi:hypothetical protein